MDPLTAGMMGASAISAAGSVGGGMWSASASKEAAKRQIKAQLFMSNTQYQRGVKDLRAAGLNPILALGSPASSPAGAMAQVPDMSGALGSVISSAAEMLQLKSSKMDVRAKKEMYDWLEKNPKMMHLFNAGLMSSTAGLPGMFPLVLATLSSAKDVPEKAKAWLKEKFPRRSDKVGTGEYDPWGDPNKLLNDLLK